VATVFGTFQAGDLRRNSTHKKTTQISYMIERRLCTH